MFCFVAPEVQQSQMQPSVEGPEEPECQMALFGISYPFLYQNMKQKVPNNLPEVFLITAGITKHPDP